MFRSLLLILCILANSTMAQPTSQDIQTSLESLNDIGLAVVDYTITTPPQKTRPQTYETFITATFKGLDTFYKKGPVWHQRQIIIPFKSQHTTNLFLSSWLEQGEWQHQPSIPDESERNAFGEWRAKAQHIDAWENAIIEGTLEYKNWKTQVEQNEKKRFSPLSLSMRGEAFCKRQTWDWTVDLTIDRTQLGALTGTVLLKTPEGDDIGGWIATGFLDDTQTLTLTKKEWINHFYGRGKMIPFTMSLVKTQDGWTTDDTPANDCEGVLFTDENYAAYKKTVEEKEQVQDATVNNLIALSSCTLAPQPLSGVKERRGHYRLETENLWGDIKLVFDEIPTLFTDRVRHNGRLEDGAYQAVSFDPMTFETGNCPITLHTQKTLNAMMVPLKEKRAQILGNLAINDMLPVKLVGPRDYNKWGQPELVITKITDNGLEGRLVNVTKKMWQGPHDIIINMKTLPFVTVSGLKAGRWHCQGRTTLENDITVTPETRACPQIILSFK